MLKRSNMSTVGLLGKKRRNRLKIIFEKIMAKNLSKVIQKKKKNNNKKTKPCHELNQLSKPVKGLVLVTQSCPTLCNPMDCSPPGFFLHGILQARTLGWVAMPFSRVSSQPRDRTQVSLIACRFFTVWATRDVLSKGILLLLLLSCFSLVRLCATP